ncbi:MAG: hypothetical protein ACYDC8_17100 [Gammaproteobacteria bacterium]
MRLLVVPCLAYQESIQILLVAVEAVEQMLAAQFLDRAEFAHSRTLGILRSWIVPWCAWEGVGKTLQVIDL